MDNKVSIQGNSLELWAAIPTLLFAIKKNNLLLTVVVGIVWVAILRFVF